MQSSSLTLDVLVHLEPVPREGWQGNDAERPLNELGQRQAERLAEELGQVQAIFASPAPRCRESLEPLAKKLGLPITELPEFRETGGNKAPAGWARGENDGPDPLGGAVSAGSAARGFDRIVDALPQGGRAVVCSYGDIIPVFLAFLAGKYGAEMPSRVNKRGSFYRITLADGSAKLESNDPPADFPA